NDECYRNFSHSRGVLHYHRRMRTFDDARNNCQTDNSNLAIIKDQAMLNRVVNRLVFNTSCSDYYHWIGLRRNRSEYRWIDGSKFDSSFLQISGNDECVALLKNSQSAKASFQAFNCSYKFSSICFVPLTASAETLSGYTTSGEQQATNGFLPGASSNLQPLIIGLSVAIVAVIILLLLAYMLRKRNRGNGEGTMEQNVYFEVGPGNDTYECAREVSCHSSTSVAIDSPNNGEFVAYDTLRHSGNDATSGQSGNDVTNVMYAVVSKAPRGNDVYSVVNKGE
uniref:C-type lectin domain-containing protein n=1 Tax=Ciona savignyi TaxID=51511 RepID=H2YEZ5_CIOSA